MLPFSKFVIDGASATRIRSIRALAGCHVSSPDSGTADIRLWTRVATDSGIRRETYPRFCFESLFPMRSTPGSDRNICRTVSAETPHASANSVGLKCFSLTTRFVYDFPGETKSLPRPNVALSSGGVGEGDQFENFFE